MRVRTQATAECATMCVHKSFPYYVRSAVVGGLRIAQLRPTVRRPRLGAARANRDRQQAMSAVRRAIVAGPSFRFRLFVEIVSSTAPVAVVFVQR